MFPCAAAGEFVLGDGGVLFSGGSAWVLGAFGVEHVAAERVGGLCAVGVRAAWGGGFGFAAYLWGFGGSTDPGGSAADGDVCFVGSVLVAGVPGDRLGLGGGVVCGVSGAERGHRGAYVVAYGNDRDAPDD